MGMQAQSKSSADLVHYQTIYIYYFSRELLTSQNWFKVVIWDDIDSLKSMNGHNVDIGDSFAIFATKSSHLSHEKHLSWKNVLKLQGQNCRKWPCPAVQWRVCGIDQRYAVPPGIHIPPSLILDIGDCSCRHQRPITDQDWGSLNQSEQG